MKASVLLRAGYETLWVIFSWTGWGLSSWAQATAIFSLQLLQSGSLYTQKRAGLHPKLNSILYLVHYFWPKVLHYIGNRVPIGMQPWRVPQQRPHVLSNQINIFAVCYPTWPHHVHVLNLCPFCRVRVYSLMKIFSEKFIKGCSLWQIHWIVYFYWEFSCKQRLSRLKLFYLFVSKTDAEIWSTPSRLYWSHDTNKLYSI